MDRISVLDAYDDYGAVRIQHLCDDIVLNRLHLRNFYKVGILEVHLSSRVVREILPPPVLALHREFAIAEVKKLTELHKTFAKAGTNKGNHLTSYKISIMKVKEFVTENEGCTIKDVVDDLGYMHYANIQSARSSILSCLNSSFEDWCRVDLTTSPARLYLIN